MQACPKIRFALLLAASWVFCGAALAQGPVYGSGPEASGMGGPGHPVPGMLQGFRAARLQALGLDQTQRAKIDRIREEARSKNWDVLGQIRAERFKLRELYRTDTLDPAAIVEQQRKVDDLKRQVLRVRLEARNQVFALLTLEQREKARSFGPRRGRPGFGRPMPYG